MSEIVNLRRARKAKARQEAAQTAKQRSAEFGVSKAQKLRTEAEQTHARRTLDGHKRSDDA